tara:strand:- start:113 stop:1939 length:1827 start_codon:yes stop_codon:yes gene_type:complete
MLIVNCCIYDDNTSNIIANTILFNEEDLSYTLLPICEHLTSKLPQTTIDDKKPQGRVPNRPFGITRDTDNIYIASNEKLCSFDINTLEYKKDISSTGRVNTHEIYYHNGYIYRCDTCINCITVINVNTLEETYIDIKLRKFIDKLYDCKQARDKDLFHLNSITINENILYILCRGYSTMNRIQEKDSHDKTFTEIYNEILNLSDTEYDNSEIITDLNNKYYSKYYNTQDILYLIDFKEVKNEMEILLILENNIIYLDIKSLIGKYNNDENEDSFVCYNSFTYIEDAELFIGKMKINGDSNGSTPSNDIIDDLIVNKCNYIRNNKNIIVLILIDKKRFKNYIYNKREDNHNNELDNINDNDNNEIFIPSELGPLGESDQNINDNEQEIIRSFLGKRKFDNFKMRLSYIINKNKDISSTINNSTIQISSNNINFKDCIKYIDLINKEQKNNILSTLPKTRGKDWNLPLLLIDYLKSESNKNLNYELIKYNIETKEFIETSINLDTRHSHNCIIIDNYIWTLGTSNGKLYKTDINTNETQCYTLVNPYLYFLRGLVNKENLLYIFASTNRYNRNLLNLTSMFIIYNINEDTFVFKELDIKIRSIRHAMLYS